MNADLEETLNELGPAYRTVVDRLRSAREVEVGESVRLETRLWGSRPALLAASLLVFLGLSAWFVSRFPSPDPQPSARPAYGAREYRMTTDEMIATQRADGGWANDFLTRRNADALKGLDDPRARIAYKKALRNLRLRQML